MPYYQYFPQGAIKVHDTQVVENIAPDEVVLDRILGGEAKYGKLHLREDRIDIFEGWLAPHPIIEYVESLPSLVYIMPTEGRPVFYNKGGLKIADADGIINFRDVGKAVSIGRNAEEHLMNLWNSPEGRALLAKHSEAFKKAGNIDYIAVGTIPEDALYGIAQLGDSVLFFINAKAYKRMEAWAERERLDVEDLIKRAMGEEMLHIIGEGKPSVEEEIAVRNSLIELYSSLARGTTDAKLKAKYEGMIRHLERDISTVRERYARTYLNGLKGLIALYKSDVGELEALLAEEVKGEGISEEDIGGYVSARLSEVKKAAKEYDGKEGKDTDGGKDSKGEAESSEEGEAEDGTEDGTEGSEGEAEGGEGGGE